MPQIHATPLRAAMIGLGNMGGRIARRIRDAGHPIAGYDRSASACERSGIVAAPSLAQAVRGADAVFLSLPDSTVIERVVHDPGGLLESVTAGQTVIDLSTASPASSIAIHAALGERGVPFIDAGISGGAAGAERGTLAVMAGGSEAALRRVQPLLDAFSARTYHMGRPGSGHATKVLNNFLNAISLAATAEVMVAARLAELDLERVLEVLNHSTGVNFATTNRFPSIIEGDYLEGGLTSELMAKDVRLYLRLLAELGVTSLAGPSCLGAFDLATALGYGGQISNRVVDAIGDIAGGVRLQGYPRADAGKEERR